MKRRTFDKEPEPHRLRTRDFYRNSAGVFAPEQIGQTRYRTPEGFLFCEGVPIARTGDMMYTSDELSFITCTEPHRGIRITRDGTQLFRDETLCSFQGKPITNDHPGNGFDVSPKNWRDLAVGVVLNPRRGEGEHSSCIVADFLITDAAAIEAVEKGKKEVSCGYDANYHQTGDGMGMQLDIVGNHVALVDRGRCGSRCSIGDHNQPEEDDDMKTRDNAAAAAAPSTAQARVRKIFTDAAAAAELAVADDDGSATHVHVHMPGGSSPPGGKAATQDAAAIDEHPTIQALVRSVNAIVKTVDRIGKKLSAQDADPDPDDEEDDGKGKEKTTKDEDPDPDEDKGKEKTKDSAAFAGSYQQVAAGVEILVPGLGMPTFDARAPRAKTVDCMCAARKRALDRFGLTADGDAVIKSVNGGKAFDSLASSCKDAAAVFTAAVAARGAANNAGATRDAAHMPGGARAGEYQPGSVVIPPLSGEQLNARNKEYWKSRGVMY